MTPARGHHGSDPRDLRRDRTSITRPWALRQTDKGLVENAPEHGRQLLSGLRDITGRHRESGDVRGLGLHGGDGVGQA
jgi:hypothetical protein